MKTVLSAGKRLTRRKLAAASTLSAGGIRVRPTIAKADLVSVLRCLLSDRLTQADGGTSTGDFERVFAETIGITDALFVVNDSAACYLLLQALKLAPQDEVIVSPLIELSIWEAMRHAGVNPIFADLAANRLTFNEKTLRAKISPRTRAIIVSHAFGIAVAETAELISSFKRSHPQLVIIEEAFAGLGARYGATKRSPHVGTLGDYGLFSLASRRMLTSAKGAIIVARTPEDLARLRMLRAPEDVTTAMAARTKKLPAAKVVPPPHDFARLELLPTELEAALGLSQLKHLPRIHARQREVAEDLMQALNKRNKQVTPLLPQKVTPSYQFLPLIFTENKAVAEAALARAGMTNLTLAAHTLYGCLARQHYSAIYDLTAKAYPVTQDLHRRTLLIPLYATVSEDELTALKNMLGSF